MSNYKHCIVSPVDGNCMLNDGLYLSSYIVGRKTYDGTYINDEDYEIQNRDELCPPTLSLEGGHSLFIGHIYESTVNPLSNQKGGHHLSDYFMSEIVPHFAQKAGVEHIKELIIYKFGYFQSEYYFKFIIYTQSQLFTETHANELIRVLLEFWQTKQIDYIETRKHKTIDNMIIRSYVEQYMSALKDHFNLRLQSRQNNISTSFVRRDREPIINEI